MTGHRRALVVLIPALALAGCVAPKAPPPPPVARPAPPPAPPPPPPPPPVAEDWRDAPLTPGTWRYTRGKDGSIAAFGTDPAAPVFTVQCAVAGREVLLFRAGVTAAQARLTTSYGSTLHPAGAILSGTGWRMAARDPALDRIALSRGRFMVEGLGDRLILPAWAEVARVIEDCRG